MKHVTDKIILRRGLIGLAFACSVTAAGAANEPTVNSVLCPPGYEIVGSLCIHPVSGDVVLQNAASGQTQAAPVAGGRPWYVVTEIAELTDAEAYAKAVAAAEPVVTQAAGGSFVARASAPIRLDGESVPARVVIIRFDSEAQARAWKDSPRIRALFAVRASATKSRSFLIEGLAN